MAARDSFGIKTLFYGKLKNTLYFASELKCLTIITNQVFEFPPGFYMDETGKLSPFYKRKQINLNILLKDNKKELYEDLKGKYVVDCEKSKNEM